MSERHRWEFWKLCNELIFKRTLQLIHSLLRIGDLVWDYQWFVAGFLNDVPCWSSLDKYFLSEFSLFPVMPRFVVNGHFPVSKAFGGLQIFFFPYSNVLNFFKFLCWLRGNDLNHSGYTDQCGWIIIIMIIIITAFVISQERGYKLSDSYRPIHHQEDNNQHGK